MCRILAVETVPSSSSTFNPEILLRRFSEACESDEWNAPDHSRQKDGWGLYGVFPDFWGIRAVLSEISRAADRNGDRTHCEFQFQLGVWKLYYTSLNEVWNAAEAARLANLLPKSTQLLVHVRAAFSGEGILSNNQPYVSDQLAYAANISFSALEGVNWKHRLKSIYPEWKLNTKQIGAERVYKLLEAILVKEPSLEKALQLLNSQLSSVTTLHGMNIVAMNDFGMAGLCGTHVDADSNPDLAQYYTLHHGTTVQDNTPLKIIASAPFGDLTLQEMKMGEVIATS